LRYSALAQASEAACRLGVDGTRRNAAGDKLGDLPHRLERVGAF
jgi:hypothetical protein